MALWRQYELPWKNVNLNTPRTFFERGMVLTGGGALLRNIDVLLSKESGVPTIVADEPLTCVARGGGEALDMIDMHGWRHFLVKKSNHV